MLHFSPWTNHRILVTGPVSQPFYQTPEKCPQLQEWKISDPHCNHPRPKTSRSCKVVNVNGTRSKRGMESTVSRTESQEGRHDAPLSTTPSVNTSIILSKTSRGHFIYTPAQLHENLSKLISFFPSLNFIMVL